ncbi:MAG: hypothetical protein KUG61_10770, partial [Parvibaculaceae bacterium]|nr:hypothetical protein [Parvibaculaceae bacterium]
VGSDPTVLISAGPQLQSHRLLHLHMPVGEVERLRAQQVVNASLSAQGARIWGQGNTLDRYQRSLIHLVDHDVWLQKRWVAEGIFRVLPGMASSRELACLGELYRAEMDAAQGRRGLWSDRKNAILGAHDVTELEKHIAEFVLVEGGVRAIGKGGGRHFINFGEDWRSDFTIVVPQSVLSNWPQDLHHPQFLQDRALSSLVGQRVRVRGWMTSYRGPEILVDDLSQIEILGPVLSPLKGMAEDLP